MDEAPGIIPARAGFTHIEYCTGGDGGDHPRSRGVYSAAQATNASKDGSSPLARGLPKGEGEDHGDDEDHPRSRGVYFVAIEFVDSERGSSPLARGLLLDFSLMGRQYGIIPARAGFTP